MVHIFRHYAMRMWLALMTGAAGTLVLIPLFAGRLPLIWTPLLFFVFLCTAFAAAGWILNHIGGRQIRYLTREARIWERAGNRRRSKKLLLKATAVFDSFLLSPRGRKQYTDMLVSQTARFFLAESRTEPKAASLITAYLSAHPEDGETAENWLQQIIDHHPFSDEQHEAAARIRRAHPENRRLQELLARFYLSAGETDFQALQVYRRLLNSPDRPAADIIGKIADRFYREQRIDETALSAYISAVRAVPGKKHLYRAVAGCLFGPEANRLPTSLSGAGRRLFKQADEAALAKLGRDFGKPASNADGQGPAARHRRTLRRRAAAAGRSASAAWKGVVGLSRTGLVTARRLLHDRRSRLILKWSAVGLAVLGIGWMAIGTVHHLLRTRTTVSEQKDAAPPTVTDPFTLQVAAYLKREHARNYVQTLQDAGLEAYFTEAESAQKRWYQVRISHFPTKEAARSFGESLKTRGLIDDFYVANYQRP